MQIKTPQLLTRFKNFIDQIHIPVLGISLLKMFEIYGQGIFKMKIGKQASSISWAFFLSLFPFLLFVLSLLPYLPHYEKLLFYIFEVFLPNILPVNVLNDVSTYLQDSILPNLKNLNPFTIFFALFFATNGTQSLINGFNENTGLKRGAVKEYAVALAITLAFIGVIILSLFGIYYSEVVLKLFTPEYNISWFVNNLSSIIGFISFPLFYFILTSLLYWMGCLKITSWKQAVPGALLTTILFVLLTYGFAIYVANFARYNVLYGSIGTIILVMIWININIILILLGNELNVAIKRVRVEKMIADEVFAEAEHYHPGTFSTIEPENDQHNRTL